MSDDQPAWRLLMAAYRAAVAAAHPAHCLAGHLPEPPADGRILVVGAGKAAAAMAQAAEAFYRTRGVLDRIDGFVTTRHGAGLPTERIGVLEAGHPVPDAESHASAVRALELAGSAGPTDLVLVLLSGGASALWSAPVEGLTPDQKQELTRQLLRSGAPITAMNTVRRHLSRIKGGKLAARAGRAHLVTLAISDVPGDDPATIGSGPTVPDPTTLDEARAVLVRFAITPDPAVVAALADAANETPKPGDAVFQTSGYTLVATPRMALTAGAALLEKAGYRIVNLGDALEGEARDIGASHARRAIEARARGERVAIVSGGELTVTVTGSGAGGPNQEYALALAVGIDGASGIYALAADTDGIDGGGGSAEDPAGAVVSPRTAVRARASALNPATFLANNDSTGFFRRVGGLVEIGATQTNVNDFRVVLVEP